MSGEPTILELEEHESLSLPAHSLSEDDARAIWDTCRAKIAIDAPSFQNDHRWSLTPQGYVGYIAVHDDLGLRLAPKVPLANLFRMLEYAYAMKIEFADPWSTSDSLDEFYERLAVLLAKKVLLRCGRGLYRNYELREEDLAFVRGRIDLYERVVRPQSVRIRCQYEEHTADLEENQILAYTLRHVARNGACGSRAMPYVRRAINALRGNITIRPFGPQECVGRLYHRLNEDYEPMHALCRFFLECSGPTHEQGDRRMLPFVVDMARVFEMFVAEWLRQNIDDEHRVSTQHHVDIDGDGLLHARIDITIEDRSTGETVAVLDTKYKKTGPIHGDIYQILTYAKLKNCSEALLVYPGTPPQTLDTSIDRTRVRSLSFRLDEDLDMAGHHLMKQLWPYARATYEAPST